MKLQRKIEERKAESRLNQNPGQST